MKPILEVKNLSKKYQLGSRSNRYIALRDVITNLVYNSFKFNTGQSKNKSNQFWALDNISFSVNRGEVIGIIGANGAGKTTLLKILTRITPPTKGEVIIRGKIASLLEVGTGFHPELTGRENIYLNGAILGMSKKEIKLKFDEIVQFSGVEKFIDTPVKRYSSGMQVRLAFSVAAHLEPDILLIDEVLAVGDADFQKKSLGKMENVSKQGRTVLFVSHNMATITRLCQRGILLKNGQIVLDSDINSVVKEYLKMDRETPAEKTWRIEDAPGDNVAKLVKVRAVNEKSKVSHTFDIRHPIILEMEYHNFTNKANLFTAFSFYDNQGTLLFVTPNWSKGLQKIGTYRAKCIIPGNLFTEGMIRIVAEISTQGPFYIKHVLEYDAISFQIVDYGKPGSVRKGWGNNLPGVLRPKCLWQSKFVSSNI